MVKILRIDKVKETKMKYLQFATFAGLTVGGAGALLVALESSVSASSDCVHPPKQKWSHDGVIASFDHAR